jgi:hypothetical protein
MTLDDIVSPLRWGSIGHDRRELFQRVEFSHILGVGLRQQDLLGTLQGSSSPRWGLVGGNRSQRAFPTRWESIGTRNRRS